MKKILIPFMFLAFSLSAMAQQDNTDQMQQQPPRETQASVERAASREAKKEDAEKKQKEAEQKAMETRSKEAELRASEIRREEDTRVKGKVK